MRRLLALVLFCAAPAFGQTISSSSNVVPFAASGDCTATGSTAAASTTCNIQNMAGLIKTGTAGSGFQLPEATPTLTASAYQILLTDKGVNLLDATTGTVTFKLISNSNVTPLAADWIAVVTNNNAIGSGNILDVQAQGTNTINGLSDLWLLPGESAVVWTDTVNYQALVGKMPYVSPNIQTGTTYTAHAYDCWNTVTLNNASAVTVTLPSTLPLGCGIGWVQLGAGQVGFSAGAGAALHNRSSQTHIAGQYGAATTYIDANAGGSAADYILAGDTN